MKVLKKKNTIVSETLLNIGLYVYMYIWKTVIIIDRNHMITNYVSHLEQTFSAYICDLNCKVRIKRDRQKHTSSSDQIVTDLLEKVIMFCHWHVKVRIRHDKQTNRRTQKVVIFCHLFVKVRIKRVKQTYRCKKKSIFAKWCIFVAQGHGRYVSALYMDRHHHYHHTITA